MSNARLVISLIKIIALGVGCLGLGIFLINDGSRQAFAAGCATLVIAVLILGGISWGLYVGYKRDEARNATAATVDQDYEFATTTLEHVEPKPLGVRGLIVSGLLSGVASILIYFYLDYAMVKFNPRFGAFMSAPAAIVAIGCLGRGIWKIFNGAGES